MNKFTNLESPLKRKKRILVFIDWFLPAYKAGGQIPSVHNIIKLFSQEVDFSIVTSNSDEGEKPFENINFDEWITNFGLRILYLSPERQNYSSYKEIIEKEEFDAAYFNSFFSYKFTSLPLFIVKKTKPQAKIILAPRGMLGKGALKIKAPKKRVFIFFSRLFNFYKNITWHASSELEANEIKNAFGKETKEIKIAIDISILPKSERIEKEKEVNSLKLFFLSRITDKKNLLGAIKILSTISEGNISYDIIGPIGSENYWQECKREIEKVPNNIKINYLGSIPNYELHEKLKAYHFFLFPTQNENYGHVIAESLAAACPVLLSDKTPWLDLDKFNAGWVIPISQNSKFKEKIIEALRMDKTSYNSMANSSIEYLNNKITNSNIIQDNRDIFL